MSCVWQTVRDHLYHLCVHATESCFLVERAVVGLLRLAIRLLRREDISSQVQRRSSDIMKDDGALKLITSDYSSEVLVMQPFLNTHSVTFHEFFWNTSRICEP